MWFRIKTLSRYLTGTLAILFLISSSTLGQTEQRPANASNTGAITGKVVNESGQALPNASVSVRAAGLQGPGEVVTTDRDGAFRVSGLQRVAYNVYAFMPAYTAPLPDPNNSQPTQYHAGDSVTLVLIKGGVITGKVSTSEGEPVVAIGVLVEMVRDARGRKLTSRAMFREVATDDRGIYRVYGLPTGTYIVLAGGTNDYSRTGINVYESDVPTYAPSSTRDTAAEIGVRAGEETTDVDIRYRAELGRMISGIVSGPAREYSGFHVILTAIGEGGSQRNDSDYQEQGVRDFVFNGIADGDYYLTAESYLENGERAVSESKLIKIRGADVTGIELVTQPLGSIIGRVVLEETKAADCTDKERPVLTETTISAWHKEQEPTKDRARFVWSFGAPAKADAQGNVTLRHLAAGEYRFVAQFSAKYWYLQSISFAPKSPSAKPMDAMKSWTRVKSGDRLSGLTVTLSQGAASMQGQVALGEGEAATDNLFVYLVPVDKTDEVLRYYGTAVSSDGKIALNNLAPGRYWIITQPQIDGVESPLTKLRLPDETETRLRLRRAAEARKNEIELKPCQNLVDFRLRL